MNAGTDVGHEQEFRYLKPIHLEWQDITGKSYLLFVQGFVDRFHRVFSLGGNLSAQSEQTINIDMVLLKPL